MEEAGFAERLVIIYRGTGRPVLRDYDLTMNGRENINSKAVLPSVLLTTTL
jgi:hypothetical protein